jgi:hypothetical protein
VIADQFLIGRLRRAFGLAFFAPRAVVAVLWYRPELLSESLQATADDVIARESGRSS